MVFSKQISLDTLFTSSVTSTWTRPAVNRVHFLYRCRTHQGRIISSLRESEAAWHGIWFIEHQGLVSNIKLSKAIFYLKISINAWSEILYHLFHYYGDDAIKASEDFFPLAANCQLLLNKWSNVFRAFRNLHYGKKSEVCRTILLFIQSNFIPHKWSKYAFRTAALVKEVQHLITYRREPGSYPAGNSFF